MLSTTFVRFLLFIPILGLTISTCRAASIQVPPAPPAAGSFPPASNIQYGDVFTISAEQVQNLDQANPTSDGIKAAKKKLGEHLGIVISGPDAGQYELAFVSDNLPGSQPKKPVTEVIPGTKMTGSINLWVPFKVKAQDLLEAKRKREHDVRGEALQRVQKEVADNRGKSKPFIPPAPPA